MQSFYSRLGFKVIKDFATSTDFEEARSRFHYETGKSKADQKKILEVKKYLTTLKPNLEQNDFNDALAISIVLTQFVRQKIIHWAT